jgi:hypothetical protein
MYQIHSIETTPEASRPGLEKARKTYTFIPNLYGVFADYTNHIAETPLDTVFEPQRWEKRTQRYRGAGSPSAPHASILRAAR